MKTHHCPSDSQVHSRKTCWPWPELIPADTAVPQLGTLKKPLEHWFHNIFTWTCLTSSLWKTWTLKQNIEDDVKLYLSWFCLDNYSDFESTRVRMDVWGVNGHSYISSIRSLNWLHLLLLYWPSLSLFTPANVYIVYFLTHTIPKENRRKVTKHYSKK